MSGQHVDKQTNTEETEQQKFYFKGEIENEKYKKIKISRQLCPYIL